MRKLSPSRRLLLELILKTEPTILSKVLMENDIAKSVRVMDDGSITLGRSKRMWINRLTGDYRTVSLLDIAVSAADAITGSGSTRNDNSFNWMIRDIMQSAVKERNCDKVVDILFDSLRHGSDGELASKFIPQEDIKKYENDPRIKSAIRTGNLGVYGRVMLNSGSTFDVLLGELGK